MTPDDCPKCGHDLSRRPIPLREWLLHPVRSLRQRRFDADYPVWHMLLNHGQSTTLHGLSSDVAAKWNA